MKICGINTLESGVALRRFLDGGRVRKAVVVGGGYIGLEMVEALISRGLEVSLVARSKEVMATLDDDMGRLISEALLDFGVTLYREEALTGFETRGTRW